MGLMLGSPGQLSGIGGDLTLVLIRPDLNKRARPPANEIEKQRPYMHPISIYTLYGNNVP